MIDNELEQWRRMTTWVSAAFDEATYEHYAQKPGYFRVDRSLKDYVQALNTIDFPVELPSDLQKMIAFLSVDGFFSHYHIAYNDWFHSKDFERLIDSQYSVSELLASKQGLDYLRECLVNLSWWHLTRGDLQGT
ncbi:hypothetical protein ACFSUS_27790 [Spirosoma soli]|uniref:Uncharacterized protein n=1 Tax=Spirosoma soli TaxID=1770529 RepID=A0ABW5ME31_9BACT